MSQSSLPAMLYPFARPTATEFLRIVRGEGTLVFDDEGNDYVDATSSLWFATVGHGRTEIADAVSAQMSRLAAFHTFERFSNDTVEELSNLLVADAPMDDARVFFTNSGSEAADTGIKIARAARTLQGKPEKSVIVAVDGADVPADELRALVRGRLRSSRVPAEIVVWDELPHNEMGKLLRKDIRAALSQRVG